MLLNLLKTFGLKAVYGIVGLLLLAVAGGVAMFQLPPDAPAWMTVIWNTVIAGLFVGFAAVLKRVGQTLWLKATGKWNPAKVGK